MIGKGHYHEEFVTMRERRHVHEGGDIEHDHPKGGLFDYSLLPGTFRNDDLVRAPHIFKPPPRPDLR